MNKILSSIGFCIVLNMSLISKAHAPSHDASTVHEALQNHSSVDALYAPWRDKTQNVGRDVQHVAAVKTDECPFCLQTQVQV